MTPILRWQDIAERIETAKGAKDYLAMYSSWWKGIVKDPRAMLVPLDDHIVHRGDGVFEALRSIKRHLYLLTEHLDRLERSARQIHLEMPCSRPELVEIVKDVARSAGRDDMGIRIFVSRGPGGFSANPYDTVGSQLYVVATTTKLPAPDWYTQGVRARRSQVPMKEPFFASVKSCNYLHNVLMRKEAADWGVEFTLGFNSDGALGEGSTENVMVVTESGELVMPRLETILQGTTMLRLRSLCESILEDGYIHGIESRDIGEEEIFSAREVMIVGTTLDVLPCVNYEGERIGDGRPGPVAQKALRLLRQDQDNPRDVSGRF